MWVITTKGAFSAVQHRDNPDLLVVRTRDHGDAERLEAFYQDFLDETAQAAWVEVTLPDYPSAEILAYEVSDYPWRVIMPKTAWDQFLSEAVEDLDYGNFKDAVKAVQGKDRARVYTRVWSALLELEDLDPMGRRPLSTFADTEPWDEYDRWETGEPSPITWDDWTDYLSAARRDPSPSEVTAFLEGAEPPPFVSEADKRGEDYAADDERP
jgi:hypothetical protein